MYRTKEKKKEKASLQLLFKNLPNLAICEFHSLRPVRYSYDATMSMNDTRATSFPGNPTTRRRKGEKKRGAKERGEGGQKRPSSASGV